MLQAPTPPRTASLPSYTKHPPHNPEEESGLSLPLPGSLRKLLTSQRCQLATSLSCGSPLAPLPAANGTERAGLTAEEDGRLVCFWACLLPCLFVFSPLCSSPQSLLFFSARSAQVFCLCCSVVPSSFVVLLKHWAPEVWL